MTNFENKSSGLYSQIKTQYPHTTPEILIEYVKFLPPKQKEAVYLRHGKTLDGDFSFPKENQSFLNNYSHALNNLKL